VGLPNEEDETEQAHAQGKPQVTGGRKATVLLRIVNEQQQNSLRSVIDRRLGCLTYR